MQIRETSALKSTQKIVFFEFLSLVGLLISL
jgi:hypothetical protein